MGTVSTTAERRLLEESLSVIQEHSYAMKKTMEVGNVREVLRHSSALIAELRTSALSPKTYYELYVRVFAELQHLYVFFSDRNLHKRRLSDLYESVQQAGNVLPRLYLLITVGVACIKQREIPADSIFKDLVELCKGIQHPVRGLFLRYFFVQMCKDVLPDTGDPLYPDYVPEACEKRVEPSDEGGRPVESDETVTMQTQDVRCSTRSSVEASTCQATPSLQHVADSKAVVLSAFNNESLPSSAEVSFGVLCTNCFEAAKLWTRVQYQAPLRQHTKRESERHVLRVLVGTNLIHMAQLDCMTPYFYKEVALPRLLKHLVPNRDVALQQYLLECIVQVFSDECHLATLSDFLAGLCSIHSAVDTPGVLSSLIARLKKFFLAAPTIKPKVRDSREKPTPPTPQSATPENRQFCQEEDLSHKETALDCSAANVSGTPSIPDDTAALCTNGYQGSAADPSLSRTDKSVDHDHAVNDCLSELQEQDNASQISAPVAVEVDHNSQDARHLEVFTKLREGLMNLIRKAHQEDYGAHRQPPLGGSKSSRLAQAASISRLTALNVLHLLEEFLSFTLTIFPGRTDLVDSVFQLIEPVLLVAQQPSESGVNAELQESSRPSEASTVELTARLMSLPMAQPGQLSLLHARIYPSLLEQLTDTYKAQVFREICRALVGTNDCVINELACIRQLFILAATTSGELPLSSTEGGQESQRERWMESQHCIAQLIHMIRGEDTDLEFSMLTLTRDYLLGRHPDTFQTTLPALIFKALKLFARVQEREMLLETGETGESGDSTFEREEPQPNHTLNGSQESNENTVPEKGPVDAKNITGLYPDDEVSHPEFSEHFICTKVPDTASETAPSNNEPPSQAHVVTQPTISSKAVLQLVHSMCTTLVDSNAELGFRVTLQAAEAVAVANFKQPVKYLAILSEFLRQGLVCYEELLTDNKSRVKALTLLIALVASQAAILDAETLETIAEKLTRHAAKLLRKSEQCIAILQCTHLFWNPFKSDKCNMSRVQECLERSLTIVLGSLQYSLIDIGLLVQVLEAYLYHFDRSPNDVPAHAISGLLSLCSEQLAYAEGPNRDVTHTQDTTHEAQEHFRNILLHICNCQKNGNPIYMDIELPQQQ